MSIKKAMKSDAVLILSIFFGVVLTFGGVGHNLFGGNVGAGGSLAYIILMLIDIGGVILAKIFTYAVVNVFAGTPLVKLVEIGGGLILNIIASYIWFVFLYSYFKKDENRQKAKELLKKRIRPN